MYAYFCKLHFPNTQHDSELFQYGQLRQTAFDTDADLVQVQTECFY